LVRPIRPCFAAVYAVPPPKPLIPAPEEVFTMAPPPVLEHQRDLVLHAHEHAPEVDRDDPLPFLLGDIGRRVDLLFGAGVVECDVETLNASTA
jgi:hypothetical protein